MVYVLPPYVVSDANFVSSNIPETDYPVWSAATTYAVGARVIVLSTHSIYESVQASNLNNNPVVDSALAEPEWWVRVGATNRWKPFDRVIQDQASYPDIVSHTVSAVGFLDTVALFNLDAMTVRVRVDNALTPRRNLFVATGDMNHASWSKTAVTYNGTVADPDGGMAAQSFTFTSSFGSIRQNTGAADMPACQSVWARSDVVTSLNFSGVGSLSVTIGPEWTRVHLASDDLDLSNIQFGTFPAMGTVEFYRPQVEYGSAPSPYQAVDAAGVWETVIYDETQSTQDFSVISSWYDYFTSTIERSDQLLFTNIPALTGGELTVDVETPGGTPKVGEIVFGRSEYIGETHAGAKIGIESYSRNERDQFGNVLIIKRAYADTMALSFSFPADRMAYTRRLLGRLESTGIVIHNGAAALNFGLMTYGFYSDFTLPMTTAEICFAEMEIKSLI